MNKIERDIYVCRGTLPEPIEYPQWTNAIPLIFYMRDYTVPEGATIAFYMRKPSGAVIFDSGSVSGETVTVPVTTQMSAEAGRMMATVHILDGDTVLNSFNIPVFVQKTAFDPDGVESTDELNALDELLNHLDEVIAELMQAEQELSDKVAEIEADLDNIASDAEDQINAARKEALEEIEASLESARAYLDEYLQDLRSYEADFRNQFDEWFRDLQYTLDGDVAGHLEVEIENNTERIYSLVEMLMSGTASGWLLDENDNVILTDDDYGIIMDWPICGCQKGE